MSKNQAKKARAKAKKEWEAKSKEWEAEAEAAQKIKDDKEMEDLEAILMDEKKCQEV
jgi:hypothetical protein